MQNGEYKRTDYSDGSTAPQGQTGSVIPRFYKDYTRNAAGEIISSEYVQLLLPGDNKNGPVRKVTDTIRAEYPNQYAAFVRGEELSPEGTPVEMWPAVNPNLARTLKAMNIFTVEQLAEVPDVAVANLMGGRSLRDRAKVYLANAKNSAVADGLAQEKQRLQDQLDYTQKQSNAMAAQLAAMQREMEAMRAANEEAPAKRGPGRPRSNPPPDDNEAA